MQRRALVSRQVDLDDLFDSPLAQLDGDAYEQAVDAVLALQISGTRKYLFLVLQNRFGHLDCSRRRRVISRSCLEQADDLRAAVRRASDYLIDLFLRQQIGQGNACYSAVARQRDHRVAVTAQHKRGHVFDRYVQRFGYEASHARRIQNARHADHALFGKPRVLHRDVAHRIKRIRDDDQDRVPRILKNFIGNRAYDSSVGLEQIVAAHAGFSREPRRDDNDVRVSGLLVSVCAYQPRIVTLDWSSLGQIERFALWHAFDYVNQHNVAEFFIN